MAMKKINPRLDLTNNFAEAEAAAPNAPIICLTSDNDVASMLEVFDFVNGRPTFMDSPLVKASKAGTTVIVDIDIMSDPLLRKLIWWTRANKRFDLPTEITGFDKARRIPVRDGFRVIAVSEKYATL